MSSSKNLDLEGVSATLRQARDRVAALDRQLDDLIDERERTARAPVAKREAIKAMEGQIDRACKSGQLVLRDATAALARGRDMDLGALFVHQVYGNPDSARPRGDVLLALLRDPLKKALQEAVDESPAFSDDALPATERQKKVSELDGQIEQVETERDGVIRELRAAGLDVTDRLETVE